MDTTELKKRIETVQGKIAAAARAAGRAVDVSAEDFEDADQ